MKIYTMGFAKKKAEEFFGLITRNNISLLVDIRLNNKSQLAGFTKGDDLKYFLERICSCKYQHCINYAPDKEILNDWKKGNITWPEYERKYTALMKARKAAEDFISRFSNYDSVCLLCSEPSPEHCHRRLFAEMINMIVPETEIKHI